MMKEDHSGTKRGNRSEAIQNAIQCILDMDDHRLTRCQQLAKGRKVEGERAMEPSFTQIAMSIMQQYHGHQGRDAFLPASRS